MKLDIKDLDKLQDGIQDLVQKGMQAGVDGLNKGIDFINNNIDVDGKPKTDASGIINEDAPAVCTQCGAKLNLTGDSEVVVCEYCGASYNVKRSGNTVKTILEFVEKQQTIMGEKAERDRERHDRERAERRLEKLERHKMKSRRRLIRLPIIIIVLAVIYSYMKTNGYDIGELILQIKNMFGI